MIKLDDIPQKWERNIRYLFCDTVLNIKNKMEFYKTFKYEYSTTDYLYQLRHYDEWQHFGPV